MTEYIFYTTEGFTQAPDGDDIENCQLLGRAFGKDKHDALSNLVKENSWIEDRGFEPYEAIWPSVMNWLLLPMQKQNSPSSQIYWMKDNLRSILIG